jgi:prepilin-type N-terminal cleavage/methylation domain-containing protein
MFTQAPSGPTIRRAFTLVEILIVVVILGILAAIVIPAFANAASDTQESATYSELQKLRRHVGVFQARNNMRLPAVTAGDGTWGELIGRDYLLSPPVNAMVGAGNGHIIVLGAGPEPTFHTDYGWIFNATTGEVWAVGIDASDRIIPR